MDNMRIAGSNEITMTARFQFGKNWKRLLPALDALRITEAEKALQGMLDLGTLKGLSFLDVGCGSGLFSLAARRLGANVRSFDYDLESVECTEALKRQHRPSDSEWIIEQGSILDANYVGTLGTWDVVYSWGVLHHTGAMWEALANVIPLIADNGKLFIAIYNDQDIVSRMWRRIKALYCSGAPGRIIVVGLFVPLFFLQGLGIGLLKYGNPIEYFSGYRKRRGMSVYRDWIDWLGGYPFEVARPEEIVRFYRRAGLNLVNMTTTNRLGCNQFVFEKANVGSRS